MRLTSSTCRTRITRPKFTLLLPAVVLLACGTALAQTYNVGRPATATELKTWDNLVGSKGKELPVGSGSAVQGAPIFAAKCSMCHGKDGEGSGMYPRLVGNAGNMPYPTTIWDYINRAMPAWPMPKDLSPDDVYALTAFLLYKNGIISETDVMDKNSLVKVQMPKPTPGDNDGTWIPPCEHAPAWKPAS